MTKARIAVVGAGLMGHGIAQVFALAGHDVAITDSYQPNLDTAKQRIAANLRDLGDDEHAVERVRTAELADAVRDADFVVEAVVEDLQAKQWIFAEIEGHAPRGAILASNTSVIPITRIMEGLKHRERALEVIRMARDLDAVAAATGMTAADDWTKELETKGLPQLKKHYELLGVPDNVEGKYFPYPHNYNHPSRVMMFEFFNKHLKLSVETPIIDRDFVSALAFTPDGGYLASASFDKTVRLWPMGENGGSRTLRGHKGRITSVAFSPDGLTLASASEDGTVRLWDWKRSRVVRTLAGHTGGVRSVAFSNDGRYAATAGEDGTIRLWDVATLPRTTASRT